MTRKKIREHLFVLLFRVDFHQGEELQEQVDSYLEEIENASVAVKKEIRDKFQSVVEHGEEIDKKIEEKAKGWDLKRIAKADVTILRLAIFEILFDDNVPNSVAINEAVDLSKKYSGDKSPSFINGILATIAREVKPEEIISTTEVETSEEVEESSTEEVELEEKQKVDTEEKDEI